ncbi:phenylalanine--tRNA ligase subunit beta [Phaeovibrio sulfidiphilus]|uniref:Phenylalanine--tRNA ligase beta subunit n=1 Tax=Phaeovibrio sulfidiphilus TaxID=1220600 RepID=A0A8J7CNX3_9PROT|nr:phenylalanine--tRNA ligase subunit beta [Phaeovibrio sulfidiphilus]MBE1236392.1 phenylalanine--tRNA ligase subunit beta [Phaeovibrio sulfidiphilus]
MKFTLGWLKEHLDTDAGAAAIAERLTSLGLEVESVDDPSEALKDFIVGHVLEAGPHPNADRLRVCKVDTGTEVLPVVCGAPNVRTGLKVAFARVGTVVPVSGDKLKKGKIRGEESLGMICSSRELCLGADHDGIMELADDAPTGAPLASVLNVEPVIDISVTPNRADALGVRGIARDLAASGLGTLKPDPVAPVTGTFASPVGVSIDHDVRESGDCAQFLGRYFRGVKNGPSPLWLRERLEAVGLRPINALVDITNLVNLDRARPLHVFDADRLSGDIRVRYASADETLVALDGTEPRLQPFMVVIADQDRALSVAGVMGGEDTGCSEDTVNVFLESAYFRPDSIARTGRTLGMESDARYRFERGVDPENAPTGIDVATRLILDLCGGEVSDIVMAGTSPRWERTISLRVARVEAIGGIRVERARMVAMLEALGCRVTDTGGDTLEASPPSWRVDLNIEADLIEEIVRLHGYDNVPCVPLPRPPMPAPVLTPAQKRMVTVKRLLASRGLYEAVTWSFLPRDWADAFGGVPDSLVLANPISADLDTMRPSGLPNLIAACGRNATRGYPDLGLFEVGPAFHGGEPGEQFLSAAFVRAGNDGPRTWQAAARPVSAYDIKADLFAVLEAVGVPVSSLQLSADAPEWFHPGRSARVRLGKAVLAVFGEIHPATLERLDVRGPVVGAEINLDLLPLPKARPGKARPALALSAFQPVSRDFAFVLDASVPAESVLAAARKADRELIVDAAVFDVYQGTGMEPGRKSLAVSVTLQPRDATLTEADIEAVSQKVVAAVQEATGGTLRGA